MNRSFFNVILGGFGGTNLTLEKNKSYMTSIHPDQVVDIITDNNLL